MKRACCMDFNLWKGEPLAGENVSLPHPTCFVTITQIFALLLLLLVDAWFAQVFNKLGLISHVSKCIYREVDFLHRTKCKGPSNPYFCILYSRFWTKTSSSPRNFQLDQNWNTLVIEIIASTVDNMPVKCSSKLSHCIKTSRYGRYCLTIIPVTNGPYIWANRNFICYTSF